MKLTLTLFCVLIIASCNSEQDASPVLETTKFCYYKSKPYSEGARMFQDDGRVKICTQGINNEMTWVDNLNY